ncbi:MAG: GAF domain-containing protein [Armatimonadetes bacterium]|nr:GAF domain-containing protein [Armatimonadota bacterium]
MDCVDHPKIVLRPWISQEAEHLLMAVLRSIDLGILVTDLSHTTLACNEAFGRIFGIKIEDAVQQNPDEVRAMVHDRLLDPDSWYTNLEQVYADPHGTQSDLLELRNPPQTLARATMPVRDGQGMPIGRLWLFDDVTAQKRSDRVLGVLHEISLLSDPDPAQVYTAIVERISALYNTSAFLSIQSGEIMEFAAVASPIPEVRAMASNRLVDTYCQFCVEQDEPILIQNALHHARYGAIFPALHGFTRYCGAPIRDSNGIMVGTLCFLDQHSDEPLSSDDLNMMQVLAMRISSEVERETHLRLLQRDLATAQSQVIQSEKLAVAGTLSATIAHDIRNIVSAARLDLEMGLDRPEETLHQLQTHLDRFSVLAHRLLSYARPLEVSTQPTSVGDSLKRVVHLLEGHFKVADIKTEFDFQEQMPLVIADAARLDHLFVNLMMNSVQAMPHGGVLSVSSAQKNGCVEVAVQDSGLGIERDQLDQLFQPFKATGGGFGLGLYSCKQIVHEIGGQILIETNIGHGTTFRIQIPHL